MKTYIITSGIVVAYKNSFDVRVYNIQRPSKETCPQDYSTDYFSKILVQRRLNSVKKKEQDLASLIKRIQLGIPPAEEGQE